MQLMYQHRENLFTPLGPLDTCYCFVNKKQCENKGAKPLHLNKSWR